MNKFIASGRRMGKSFMQKTFQEMYNEWFQKQQEELKKAANDAAVYGTGIVRATTTDPNVTVRDGKMTWKRVPGPFKIKFDCVPIQGWNDDGCQHSWKQYQGFTESYTYCEKCDKKA